MNYQKIIISTLAYLLVFYCVGKYGIEIFHGGNNWKTGDWLINYEGGFIRRGLVGEVLYKLNGFGFGLLWGAFILQAAIYIAAAHFTLKLYFATEREVSWLLLIFSPAFIFLFPTYDIQGSFRKEIIVFLSFCLLAIGLMREKINHKYLVISLVTYFVAMLSHELTFLTLIFFIYLIYEATKDDENKCTIGRAYIAGFIIVGVVGLLFALDNTGDANKAELIRESLERSGLKHDICDGAIKWVGFDNRYVLKSVPNNLRDYLTAYPPLFLMSILPLLLTDWWKGRLPILLLGFCSLLPLYVVAIDWGRWIQIYIFMIFITLMFDSCKKKINIKKTPLILVILYAVSWSVPHCCAQRPRLGIFDVLLRHIWPI